jgi:WD40 repeat protein
VLPNVGVFWAGGGGSVFICTHIFFFSPSANELYDQTALAVHEFAPVVASGSHNQFIKVMDTGGNLISMIRYHDGFLGQRIGPVSCLAFHPHRPVLAAGATDSIVAIYSSRGKMSSD